MLVVRRYVEDPETPLCAVIWHLRTFDEHTEDVTFQAANFADVILSEGQLPRLPIQHESQIVGSLRWNRRQSVQAVEVQSLQCS